MLAGGEFELDGGVFAPVAFDFVLFGYAVCGDDGVVWGVGVGGAVGAFAVVVPDVERCAVKADFGGGHRVLGVLR